MFLTHISVEIWRYCDDKMISSVIGGGVLLLELTIGSYGGIGLF